MSRTKFPNLSIMSRQKQRSDKDRYTKDFTTKKVDVLLLLLLQLQQNAITGDRYLNCVNLILSYKFRLESAIFTEIRV